MGVLFPQFSKEINCADGIDEAVGDDAGEDGFAFYVDPPENKTRRRIANKNPGIA